MEEEAHALTERWRSGETIDCTSESFRVAVRIAARCLLRGDYMDERAERLCVALATVFRGHVPADGGTRSGRCTGCRCRPTANSTGRWPICISSSTRSSPSAGHLVKSRTIC